MVNYKEELRIKLEEHFTFPNEAILKRFNEEYEYFSKKKMIEKMFLITYLKEELIKKGLNPLIKGELTYSLLAYILDIHPLCPLDNEVSKEYGVFGFNFTHYNFTTRKDNGSLIHICFLFDEYKEGFKESLDILSKLNIEFLNVIYNNSYSAIIYANNQYLFNIFSSENLNFFELDALFKDLNLKSKIKEIVEEPFPLECSVSNVVEDKDILNLLKKYDVNSNEMLYKIISLVVSEGTYKEGVNIEKVITSREELYDKLLTKLSEEEAYDIMSKVRRGKYKDNKYLLSNLVKDGFNEDELSGINCDYMASIFKIVEVFLYYKTLIYIINRIGDTFYDLNLDLLKNDYEVKNDTKLLVEKIKLYQDSKKDTIYNELIKEELNKLLKEDYIFLRLLINKRNSKDKKEYIYLYTSIDEISKKDLKDNYIGTISLKEDILKNSKEKDISIIINKNSLNYEIKINNIENRND